MFHKAVDLKFLEGTLLEVTFDDGLVKQYNVNQLFNKYPQLLSLNDRSLFLKGKLMGYYGIIWNDELDIETKTIYEDGVTIEHKENTCKIASQAVYSARAYVGLSQKQLSQLTGIDQADISKIERGIANPSVVTLERIANALGGQLTINIVIPN